LPRSPWGESIRHRRCLANFVETARFACPRIVVLDVFRWQAATVFIRPRWHPGLSCIAHRLRPPCGTRVPATCRQITRPSRLRGRWRWCLPIRLRCRCLTKPSTASQRASVAGCQKASHLFSRTGSISVRAMRGFLSSVIEPPAPSVRTFLARSSLLRFGVFSVQGNSSLPVLFCSRTPRLVRKSEQK
jgi:hypothetical protein